MIVDTQRYRFSHGKAPKGYGLWMFDLRDLNGATRFQMTASYGEAKAAAVKEARARKSALVVVCD